MKKKLVFTILLMLVMVVLYIPTLAYAEEVNNNTACNSSDDVAAEKRVGEKGTKESLKGSAAERKERKLEQKGSHEAKRKPDSENRYIVLVLDTSGTSTFESNGREIYTADTAIDYVKTASSRFLSNLNESSGNNYVAVVSYKEYASVVSGFTTDYDKLKKKINALDASSDVRDMADGLQEAIWLFEDIDQDAQKNIVLFTTGMTNNGDYDYDSWYDEDTVGSDWYRINTGIHLYAYANAAINVSFEAMDQDIDIYTIGLFQTMEGMPASGENVVDLFRQTALDVATSPEYFYPVDDPEDLELTFGEVADNIADKKDTDKDGIPDVWERKGADIDGDGTIDLQLPKMGADPEIPDVFVEVDWMVQPEKTIAWITTRKKQSLAPDAKSMKKVYAAFQRNGINLHIDAGRNSIDYVTGKKWGNLSGGNEIPYEDVYELGEEYESWINMVSENFSSDRQKIFHHCTFLHRFHLDGLDKTTSGISQGIPGQYFIVANQQWVRDTGEYGIAGTFMHELGHNLGLCHGGFDGNGNADYLTTYKPNHLSVMNYLYQTSGLSCSDKNKAFRLNYSPVSLPDLNENRLIEKDGIDPFKATSGLPYKAKFQYKNWAGVTETKEVSPSYGTAMDFNNSGDIDSNPVSADVNQDGKKTILRETTPEWSRIVFNGGSISIDSETDSGVGDSSKVSEMTVNEALKHDVLAEDGTGALEALGPFTLVADTADQKIFLRVKNMGSEDAAFTLDIPKSSVTNSYSQVVEISGSVKNINYIDVPINIKRAKAGEYKIKAILKYSGKNDVVLTVPLTLATPLKEDIAQLKKDLSQTPEEDLETGVSDELNELSIRFDTEKLPQPMSVQTAKKTIKAKKLKKKAQKVSAISIVNSQGEVEFSRVGGNKESKKALKVNAKTGKITVKKKTKKGTYTIKVKVKAAGTDEYKAASQTVKVKIKVK